MISTINKIRNKVFNLNGFFSSIIFNLIIFLLSINLTIFPWTLEGTICSLFFEKEEVTAKINDTYTSFDDINVKYKLYTIFKCYFECEGKEIEVIPSISKNYKIGDDFTYYQYVLNNIEHNSAQNFDFIRCFIALVFTTFYSIFAFIFLLGEEKKEKPKIEKYKIPNNFRNLSKKELLEICKKSDIKINKQKEKDINYIKNVIASKKKDNEDFERYVKENKKLKISDIFFYGFFIIIATICLPIVLLNYYNLIKFFILIIL